jgi:hypothetical protein
MRKILAAGMYEYLRTRPLGVGNFNPAPSAQGAEIVLSVLYHRARVLKLDTGLYQRKLRAVDPDTNP